MRTAEGTTKGSSHSQDIGLHRDQALNANEEPGQEDLREWVTMARRPRFPTGHESVTTTSKKTRTGIARTRTITNHGVDADNHLIDDLNIGIDIFL